MLRNLQEFNLPAIEEKVLENWKGTQVFKKLQARKAGKGKTFRFYEGPPYANGHPGIHHIISRVFKDIILRYKSMTGFSVPRRAGWDTHGLPIELAVEKELGIKNKNEIDKLGVAVFNKKAREIIWRYLDEWEKFTERIGYWLDLKDPYITCENDYIESLWWIFKEVEKRGYLKESRKVVPYCPRCETPLS
ncbi:MAG: class I tRNA ligase family protein, partial [Candidatus Colwellbacteria bacterium]|nr:class I tRNA ligase family protein [Candidatus Colwellbacteria bacterium]